MWLWANSCKANLPPSCPKTLCGCLLFDKWHYRCILFVSQNTAFLLFFVNTIFLVDFGSDLHWLLNVI